MRLRAGILSVSALAFITSARAQDSTSTWALNGSLLTILYRDTIALWNPSVAADHKNLHLEARYQWEDWRTTSLWAGRWFGFGNELHVDIAPMAGVVFGNTNGVAPGYVLEAGWRSLSLYSSSEYLVDLEDNAYNFTYTWSELAVDLKLLKVGMVVQRTRTFDSPLDLQRGLLLLREQGAFTFGTYIFNIGWTDPTVALTLSYDLELSRHREPTTP